MIFTKNLTGKDDEKVLYDLLGNKDGHKKFDAQFKKAESNFKIAIVVETTTFTPPSVWQQKPRHRASETSSSPLMPSSKR